MAQALQTGELDYAQQRRLPTSSTRSATEENIVTVEGTANGFTELGFNTYGTGTGNTIEGGGAVRRRPCSIAAFRDALGYAIDKAGAGRARPRRLRRPSGRRRCRRSRRELAQVEPATPRTFDIEVAKQKLEAAGYALDAGGKRLDKEGKPIDLRLVCPDSETDLRRRPPQFITDLVRRARDHGQRPQSPTQTR